MKKIPIVLFISLFSLMAVAQNKKVAILETIDKEGNVDYSVELMVRSNLTKAISSTPGFEGYDRVNMSQIMGEQDFQRTGLVNEEQIKRLGEMCGADYILVSEAVKFDGSNIFVTATILNVETAQALGAENELMGTGAKEIQKGCEALAMRLFGTSQGGSFISGFWNRVSGNKQDEKQPEKKPEETTAKPENPKPVVTPAPTPSTTPTKEQQATIKRKPRWFVGLNVGAGWGNYSEYSYNDYYGFSDNDYPGPIFTAGFDLAFPIGRYINVGGYLTGGYELGNSSPDGEMGLLLLFNFNKSGSIYLGGGKAIAYENAGNSFRFGYKFKNGLYLFGNYITTSDSSTYEYYGVTQTISESRGTAFVFNIGYSF